jgi:hypothetical protein
LRASNDGLSVGNRLDSNLLGNESLAMVGYGFVHLDVTRLQVVNVLSGEATLQALYGGIIKYLYSASRFRHVRVHTVRGEA